MGSIVCVEASAEQGSWVAGILEQRGHTVTRVTGEGEAAPLLDTPSDLWLIDGDLAGSALRLVARLRKLGSKEQLPILFVAARDTEDAVLRAHAAGANEVLTPPLSRAQLIMRVKRLLDARVPTGLTSPSNWAWVISTPGATESRAAWAAVGTRWCSRRATSARTRRSR